MKSKKNNNSIYFSKTVGYGLLPVYYEWKVPTINKILLKICGNYPEIYNTAYESQKLIIDEKTFFLPNVINIQLVSSGQGSLDVPQVKRNFSMVLFLASLILHQRLPTVIQYFQQ